MDVETAPCAVECPVDCILSPFSSWSACSAHCGGGYEKRSRTVLVEPSASGVPCGALSESRFGCNPEPCPVNCEVSSWKKVSECTLQCHSTGIKRTQRFARDILVEPQNDGQACPKEMQREEECQEPHDSLDISACYDDVLGKWAIIYEGDANATEMLVDISEGGDFASLQVTFAGGREGEVLASYSNLHLLPDEAVAGINRYFVADGNSSIIETWEVFSDRTIVATRAESKFGCIQGKDASSSIWKNVARCGSAFSPLPHTPLHPTSMAIDANPSTFWQPESKSAESFLVVDLSNRKHVRYDITKILVAVSSAVSFSITSFTSRDDGLTFQNQVRREISEGSSIQEFLTTAYSVTHIKFEIESLAPVRVADIRVEAEHSPIDCVVGDFSKFDECPTQSPKCTSHIRKRTRPILVQPLYGGTSCPSTEDKLACTNPDCAFLRKMEGWTLLLMKKVMSIAVVDAILARLGKHATVTWTA